MYQKHLTVEEQHARSINQLIRSLRNVKYRPIFICQWDGTFTLKVVQGCGLTPESNLNSVFALKIKVTLSETSLWGWYIDIVLFCRCWEWVAVHSRSRLMHCWRRSATRSRSMHEQLTPTSQTGYTDRTCHTHPPVCLQHMLFINYVKRTLKCFIQVSLCWPAPLFWLRKRAFCWSKVLLFACQIMTKRNTVYHVPSGAEAGCYLCDWAIKFVDG